MIPAGRDGGSSGAARDVHLIDEIGGGSIDTAMGLFWLQMTILWDYIVPHTLKCVSGRNGAIRLISGNSPSITSPLKLSIGILEGSRMPIIAIVPIKF